MQGGYYGGIAEGLGSGVAVGMGLDRAKRLNEEWGLDKRAKTLAVERAEAEKRTEDMMNEAGLKVFQSLKMTHPDLEQGGIPPFEVMTKVFDARMFAAMDGKRPDLAFEEAKKGVAIREANLAQLQNDADREFAVGGDLNAYTKAWNRLYPGTNLTATSLPDGRVRLQGERLGKPVDETLSANDFQMQVQMSFQPKTMRDTIRQQALARYTAARNAEAERAKPIHLKDGEKVVVPAYGGQPERTIENPRERRWAYDSVRGAWVQEPSETAPPSAAGIGQGSGPEYDRSGQGAGSGGGGVVVPPGLPPRPTGAGGSGGGASRVTADRQARYEMLRPILGETQARLVAFGGQRLPSEFDVNKAAERIVSEMDKALVKASEREEFKRNRQKILEEVKQRLVGETPRAGLADTSIQSRFEKDSTIPKGSKLGPKTDKGYEVRDASGALIGHYE